MARQYVTASSEYTRYTTFAHIDEPFTMACWAYRDQPGDFVAFSIAEASSANQQHRLRCNSSIFQAGTYDGTPGGEHTCSETLYSFVWNHLCGVYTSDTSRYGLINGVNSNPVNTQSQTVANIDRVAIGTTADSTPYGPFDGRIAEAAIWNVALTQSEISVLALGYSPLFVRPSALIFYAPLVRSTQDLLQDYTISENGTPTVGLHPRIIYPRRCIIPPPKVAASDTTQGDVGMIPGGVFAHYQRA